MTAITPTSTHEAIKEITMPDKTPVTLPPTVPAGVVARMQAEARRAPTRTASPKRGHNVSDFGAWKAAIETARQVTGYDSSSPIYGKTDIEVLTALRGAIADLGTKLVDEKTIAANSPANAELGAWIGVIEELLKRKVAKTAAGELYRSRK